MAEEVQTAPEGAAVAETYTPVTAPGEGNISLRDAARALASARKPKEPKQPEAPPPSDPDVEVSETQRLADEANAAPPDAEAPGETQEADPAEEQPSIEPPRSWTKEAKERWNSLPRETQEYLAEREQERDREVRRSQNEAAEKLKGLTAKEQAVEQARQQYEAALPILAQNIQASMSAEFADIQTMADVQKLAQEDWPRYARWDAQQKQLAAVQQEHQTALERQNAERAAKFAEFAKAQDALLIEKVPDLADKDKAAKLQKAALGVLHDAGFTDQELSQSWNGEGAFNLRDHRWQAVVIKAAKYDAAQQTVAEKVTAAKAKPLPPVQRPGVAQPKGAQREATIQALTQRLDKSSGINALRAASQLIAERRRGGRA
jgi:hypothetical protein